MNLDFIVCAYATEKYLHFADRLENILKQNDIEYDIDRYDQFGDFADIQLFKPAFIKRKMELYEKPIMYVDVDTVFTSYPEIPQKKFDIGILERIGPNGMSLKGLKHGNFLTLGKTTENSIKLLNKGKEYCDEKDFSKRRDHKRLQGAKKEIEYKELILNKYLKNSVVGYTERGELPRPVVEKKNGK